MQDRIERSIDISASLERVWDLVTEPGWWVPTDSDAAPDRTPGNVTVLSTAKWGAFPVQVVELRPMTYAAFRWASKFPGADLAEGRTTLIEFTLQTKRDGVEVAVVESGFADLAAPEGVREKGVQDNSSGWDEELSSLRTRAEVA